MNITLSGTKVSMDGHTLAFQKNNLVDSMVITVDTDETWQYKLDVKYPCKDSNGKELYNVIDLTRVGNTCTAILQATMLPFNGKYTMQLRGVSGDKVYHTDTFDVWVKYSIDPGKVYDPVPSEFYQIEQAVTEQAANAKQSATESAESATNAAASATKAENAVAHSPIVGENGNWLIWDFEKSEYVDSGKSASTPPITPDTAGKYLTNDGSKAEWGVPSGGGTDPSLGITGAQVGQIAKITAVDTNGKPTAWEPVDIPSGGGEKWRLVRTITLEENVTAIDISEDNNGNPFALKKIRIYGNTLGTASGGQLRINVANKTDDTNSILGPYYNFKGLDTVKRGWVAESEFFGIINGKGNWSEWYNTPDTIGIGVAYARAGFRRPKLDSGQYIQDRVEFLHIFSNTIGVEFAAGSYIELWGVDA